MKQQINLYQVAERQALTPWSSLQLLAVSVLVLLGMLLWWGLERSRLAELQHQQQAQLAAHQRLTQAIQALEQERSALDKDLVLEQALRAARTELRAKRATVDYFAGLDAQQLGPFSSYLEGLARRHLQGLWLRQVTLQVAGQQLRLEGSAVDAYLVPQFLRALGEEQAFGGRHFNSLLVQRPETQPNKIDFVLNTQTEEQDK